MTRLTKEQTLLDMPPPGALPPVPGLGLSCNFDVENPLYAIGVIDSDGYVRWEVCCRFYDTVIATFDYWRQAADFIRDQY